MIKIDLETILEKQDRTLYWLSRESGLPYPTLHKIVNTNTKSISLSVLEAICKALNVTPNDLFVFIDDESN